MASALRVAAVAPASAPVARRSTFVKGARALKIAPRRASARVVDPAVRAAAVAEPASAPAGGGVERGSGFEVHKFGGTCVGSSERISGCCDLLIELPNPASRPSASSPPWASPLRASPR